MNITYHFDNFRNKGEEIRRLNVFENMALREIFGIKVEEVNVIFRHNCIICTFYCVLLHWLNQAE
jgi:hypothetical protein